MQTKELSDVKDLWKGLLIDVTFARNYPIACIGELRPVARNPVLEKILPSLLQIKAVSILDHALKLLIEANGMAVPKKYKSDLNGRIDYLADQGIIADRQPLDAIRRNRNALAHEPGGSVTWPELDRDITTINNALQELAIVGDQPQLEIHAERSAAQDSPDPSVICVIDYQIAVKEEGKVVAEINWSTKMFKDG